jgi:hypothetical protein
MWFREEITFFSLSLDNLKIEKNVKFRSRWKAMARRSERIGVIEVAKWEKK